MGSLSRRRWLVGAAGLGLLLIGQLAGIAPIAESSALSPRFGLEPGDSSAVVVINAADHRLDDQRDSVARVDSATGNSMTTAGQVAAPGQATVPITAHVLPRTIVATQGADFLIQRTHGAAAAVVRLGITSNARQGYEVHCSFERRTPDSPPLPLLALETTVRSATALGAPAAASGGGPYQPGEWRLCGQAAGVTGNTDTWHSGPRDVASSAHIWSFTVRPAGPVGTNTAGAARFRVVLR